MRHNLRTYVILHETKKFQNMFLKCKKTILQENKLKLHCFINEPCLCNKIMYLIKIDFPPICTTVLKMCSKHFYVNAFIQKKINSF